MVLYLLSRVQVREDGVVIAWFDHFPPIIRAPVKGESG